MKFIYRVRKKKANLQSFFFGLKRKKEILIYRGICVWKYLFIFYIFFKDWVFLLSKMKDTVALYRPF